MKYHRNQISEYVYQKRNFYIITSMPVWLNNSHIDYVMSTIKANSAAFCECLFTVSLLHYIPL